MTPAVEAAKRAGIEFRLHEYEGVEVGEGDYALAVAAAVGRPPEQLFKTLVASVDGRLEVFVVPADRQLDLRAVGKRTKLAVQAEAERATGYVVGGISPLGQRRRLPTTVDESALAWDTILVSAGKRGLQIELAPDDLVQFDECHRGYGGGVGMATARSNELRAVAARLVAEDAGRHRPRGRPDRKRLARRRRRRLRRRDAPRHARAARPRHVLRARARHRARAARHVGAAGAGDLSCLGIPGGRSVRAHLVVARAGRVVDQRGVARCRRDRERRLRFGRAACSPSWQERLRTYPDELAAERIEDAALTWGGFAAAGLLTIARPGERLALVERMVDDASRVLQIVYAINRTWLPTTQTRRPARRAARRQARTARRADRGSARPSRTRCAHSSS